MMQSGALRARRIAWSSTAWIVPPAQGQPVDLSTTVPNAAPVVKEVVATFAT